MEQFQYSLFIAGKSQVDNIQPGNVGGNGYDIAILYPPENISKIEEIEKSLSGQLFHYIPKNKLPDEGFGWIKDGDIIAITTNIPGLDVVHLGLACYEKGEDPRCLYALECADMKLRDSLTVSGLLAAVMSSMKPCLMPLFTQSAM